MKRKTPKLLLNARFVLKTDKGVLICIAETVAVVFPRGVHNAQIAEQIPEAMNIAEDSGDW